MGGFYPTPTFLSPCNTVQGHSYQALIGRAQTHCQTAVLPRTKFAPSVFYHWQGSHLVLKRLNAPVSYTRDTISSTQASTSWPAPLSLQLSLAKSHSHKRGRGEVTHFLPHQALLDLTRNTRHGNKVYLLHS